MAALGALASDANAGEVRAAHRIDEAKLRDYLKDHIEVGSEFSVRQFSGGQSNPTYLIETAGRKYVLRKKPPGKLLKSAHQVDREYRIMKALAQTDVPVPTMRVLCQDESVIGTDFYVMDFLTGRIFRDPTLPNVAPAERAAIYDNMNDVMARLHKVDFAAVGLADFGRPGNYFERQVARWITQYRGAQTDDIPAMEDLIAWMPEHIPSDDSVSIAHGDYRLENSIFHPTEPKMIAVLDWELSTIGHPLADVGYNCIGYRLINPRQGGLVDTDFKTSGIPDEATYVSTYCKRVGRDYPIPNWDFYIAFSLFRLASIGQGVYKRGLDGNASSETAALNNGCAFLAEAAAKMVKIR
ncbi:MAG: phosphotransferase [Alphaproteobacteria bacterium]|nr:phosphotransferase [Alphaproteobacteria bacterium]